VFLEETSLVARPAVPFPDLKERLDARMKWLGIKVRLQQGWVIEELSSSAWFSVPDIKTGGLPVS
jgi:hypothetical protein